MKTEASALGIAVISALASVVVAFITTRVETPRALDDAISDRQSTINKVLLDTTTRCLDKVLTDPNRPVAFGTPKGLDHLSDVWVTPYGAVNKIEQLNFTHNVTEKQVVVDVKVSSALTGEEKITIRVCGVSK